MQYLTYKEYKEIGGVLDETAFKCFINRSCGIIDNATHRRIENMNVVPDRVKSLCKDLVEYLSTNKTPEATVTSRSQAAGPVSESESYTVKTEEQQATEIGNLIRDYLISEYDDNGIPLLYRGCDA